MPQSILDSSVEAAIKQNAADIIFSFSTVPSLKVNGSIVRLDHLPALDDSSLQLIVKELVSPEKKAILDKDLQVDLAYSYDKVRFRVNIFFQRGHLCVVMRYIHSQIPTIEELALPEIVKDLVANDNGLILMVGPTGSGKSTSLAAMIGYLNENFDKHIITIEDPVEYVYENEHCIIEQRELGMDAVGFTEALRSTLRESPDVILLGEMRDLDSIATAITVAETGHLVLSTIHANNAAGTVDRIVDIFPEAAKEQIRVQLSDILIAILNQRLVPKLDGSGSMAVIEVMVANSAVKNAIRSGNTAQLPNIIQTSSSEGMFLLDDLLIKAVRKGEIDKETALDYANDRNEMRKSLNIV